MARMLIIPAEQRVSIKAGEIRGAVFTVYHGPVIPKQGPSEQHHTEFNLSGNRAGRYWLYHDIICAMTPSARHHQRKRSTRLRPLSSLAEKLTGPGLQKRSRFLAKLIADWPVIAGDAAAFCLPVDLQFQNSKRVDGTLVVSVVSGRGPQLQMMSRALIIQVNRSLGFAAVGRIRLRQDLVRPLAGQPKPPQQSSPSPTALSLHQLEEATSHIQSPELRAALIRLGQNINR